MLPRRIPRPVSYTHLHRVVHAGEKFAHSVLIDDAVIKALEECIELAPLHNPPNLLGIAACQELMPDTPMVGVFDTAFHQTMPPESYIYALPYEYYEKYGVRRYGFHGTSHKYVSERAADMLNVNLDDLKPVSYTHLADFTDGIVCGAAKYQNWRKRHSDLKKSGYPAIS